MDRVGGVSAEPRLHRRAAVAGGLGAGLAGLAALTGCDDGDNPGPSGTPTPDPDTVLVEGVRTRIGRAQRVATAAGLPRLAALHRAHLAALDGEPPTGGRRTHPTPADVRRVETRLQQHLVEAAASAESGALARLLASMSAAVAQRLAAGLA